MIQEKDFLYRVPVKTAPITTPGGQIRNPEILVDVEGGEFMHGNILDANSTNKLINQSVKDAVDNKLVEGGHVTKDLLEAETTRATEQENSLKALIDAETSARTKGDEDLSSKIKAEQTRAEGKEKEISDKLAIVNGDSNTEGSFRKAIADVVAAAPEDLDTLKEIADKLAGNDDLHTALNQAITEKADASALANEVARATGAESGLQAAIATKADATALSNYVLTTALNKQVDTLNAAISGKQDAGNYIPYDKVTENGYSIDRGIAISNDAGHAGIDCGYIGFSSKSGNTLALLHNSISGHSSSDGNSFEINPQRIRTYFGTNKIEINQGGLTISAISNDAEKYLLRVSPTQIALQQIEHADYSLEINPYGIKFMGRTDKDIPTGNGNFINIGNYAQRSELPTKVSQLTNDSNFIAATTVTAKDYEINRRISIIGAGVKISSTDSTNSTASLSASTLTFNDTHNGMVVYGINGIHSNQHQNCVLTTDNGFKSITDFASTEQLQIGLEAKQNKITVNSVDVTDIETADISKLRTIVTNLIDALSASGLIRQTETLE